MHHEYPIDHPEGLLSPSLLIFPEKVRRNLRKMIEMAGRPNRLRPHVKTHKMADLARMVEEHGIHKHKCATIAEAEMLARAGATDVLIGYPPVGPNVARVARLVEAFPETIFRVVVDEEGEIGRLDDEFRRLGKRLRVLLDLDIGMHRTGIAPGEQADRLYRRLAESDWLIPDGLHAYDGHQRQPSLEERRQAVREATQPVFEMRDRLEEQGLPVPRLVLGGTPTFPVHSEWKDPTVECSPGTCVLHDVSYATKFPDLDFEAAALLLGRVISRPGPGRLCLDIGYKAVAADPVGDRLKLLTIPEATLGPQSEEHLVVETPHAEQFPPGTPVLAIPMHICPTCALHARAYVMEHGRAVSSWDVTARDRFLTI